MPCDDPTCPDAQLHTPSHVETEQPPVASADNDTADDTAENEEPDTSCDVCDESEEDCECRDCGSCGHRVVPDEWCSTCECCDRHCSCWYCKACSERHGEDDYQCPCCEVCERSCECWTCEHCGERFRGARYSPCERCERCTDCCECCNDIPYCERRAKPRHAKCASERRTNRSRRLIGVEIEVHHNKRDDASALWDYCDDNNVSVVEDGSLPSTGYELNTVPCAGDHFIQHIAVLGEHLARAGATVTSVCGLHCHVDASDFTFYDMRRLVMLYAKVESAMFAMMPTTRRDSSYCQPCGMLYSNGLTGVYKSKAAKAMLIGNVYGGAGDAYIGRDFKHLRQSKRGSARYHALNVHSWLFRGTIEFRLHTGTVSSRKIIAWGMLCASILDAAMRMTEAEINAITTDTLNARIALLCFIAPTDSVRDYIRERIATHESNSVAEEIA